MNNLHFFKLITGEEIIAKAKKGSNAWSMENPVKLMFTQQGVAMMPYLEPARSLCTGKDENKLTMLNEHIMFADEVSNEEIFNAYNSKFGSGIVLAGSSNVLKIAGD
jgi:hypothetical protein